MDKVIRVKDLINTLKKQKANHEKLLAGVLTDEDKKLTISKAILNGKEMDKLKAVFSVIESSKSEAKLSGMILALDTLIVELEKQL